MRFNGQYSFGIRLQRLALAGCLYMAASVAAAQSQTDSDVETKTLEPVEKKELAPAGEIYLAISSSLGPRESHLSTLPCVYQSPRTMRLALRWPTSTV